MEEQAVVLPSQRAIGFGTVWARYVPNERGCTWGHGCSHFHWGRVLSVKEYALGRLAAGDGPEDIREALDTLRLRHLRGWRLSEVHCDASRQAELCSVAVAGIWPIYPLEYRMAKDAGFNRYRIVEESWFRHLFRRYRAETRAEAEAAGLLPAESLFVPRN